MGKAEIAMRLFVADWLVVATIPNRWLVKVSRSEGVSGLKAIFILPTPIGGWACFYCLQPLLVVWVRRAVWVERFKYGSERGLGVKFPLTYSTLYFLLLSTLFLLPSWIHYVFYLLDSFCTNNMIKMQIPKKYNRHQEKRFLCEKLSVLWVFDIGIL